MRVKEVALIVFFVIVIVVLIFLIIDKSKNDSDDDPLNNQNNNNQQIENLTDIQIVACEAAAEGGTCHTRLSELDIVAPIECCEKLNLCCQDE